MTPVLLVVWGKHRMVRSTGSGKTEAVQAGLWGLPAGSALLVGAAIGYGLRVPQKVIATVMAFGAGVLLSAVSF